MKIPDRLVKTEATKHGKRPLAMRTLLASLGARIDMGWDAKRIAAHFQRTEPSSPYTAQAAVAAVITKLTT